MTDEKTVNFKTACSSCVFAQYNNEKQYGCDLDRLSIYLQNNLAEYDEETNSFIIQTICNTCRGQVWSNKNIGKNLIAEVEREARIGFDFMLLGVDIDMEKIESRLPDVINQCVSQKKIKPKTINIVVKGIGIVIPKLHEITLDYSDCGVKFNITRILDISQTKADCVDAVMKKCKNQYCGVFNLCDNVPSNLLCVLNNLINVKLKNINMVEPFHGFSGLIIQPSLYNLFGGNKNMRIVDKIIEAATIQNKEKNIYKWEDLWTPE